MSWCLRGIYINYCWSTWNNNWHLESLQGTPQSRQAELLFVYTLWALLPIENDCVNTIIIGCVPNYNWGEPEQAAHLSWQQAHARNNGIYVSIFLCLYHLPRVCHTLVPEIRLRPEMLRVFQYIDVLTCVIYNCMHSTEQQGRLVELLVSAVKIIDEDR